MKKEITTKDLKNFGLVVGGVFIAIGLLPLLKQKPVIVWPIIIGTALEVLGAIMPLLLKPVYKIWMMLARILGAINARIILTIFYCVILVPIGIIMKVFKKDMIGLKIRKDAASYWIRRKAVSDPKRFEYPF